MPKASIKVGSLSVRVDCDGEIDVKLSTRTDEASVTLVDIELDFGSKRAPPVVRIGWDIPSIGVLGRWYPASSWEREKGVDWGGSFGSKGTTWPPIICHFDREGLNYATASFSDTLNPLRMKAGVYEETVALRGRIELFVEPCEPRQRYRATLRIDTRKIPYSRAIADVTKTWERDLPSIAPVPSVARKPMYSTWYSFHQNLTIAEVEKQCALAKELGCESVIVDDGWQTLDDQRGYAFCGDWEPVRMPQFAAHVARVKALGLRYLLWFSVPYVGDKSRAWRRFEHQFLDIHGGTGGKWGVLDPRFPEVRAYLLDLYERAVVEWGIDGLKLDFVDAFNLRDTGPEAFGGGRDMDSVPEAVECLLQEVWQRLEPHRPELLIEFRQSYVGPRMRRFGNMFRAGDCPNDQAGNRVRTIDVRLLSRTTATHADMMEWHPDEPTEHAATQLLHTLFAVPQISVMLDRIPAEHLEMLRFWLDFVRENEQVLQLGELWPQYPECGYPAVAAWNETSSVLAVYSNVVARLGSEAPARWLIVNACPEPRIALELSRATRRKAVLFDTRGRTVKEHEIALVAGLNSIEVPSSGLCRLEAI
jgi:alpha-galactosidase